MNKTAAAKHFAATYGVYSNGYYTLTEIGTNYRKFYERAVEREKLAAEQHEADLRVVMTLLGVEDQYEDTVEKRGHVYLAAATHIENVVTKTAAQKFAEDLRAAQSAINGEAALKRLRKAVKTVQKEQNK
jgi:hypothetical protein